MIVQKSLFDKAGKARRTDPITSVKAAKRVKAGSQRMLILSVFLEHGELTADEVWSYLPNKHYPSITTRVSELGNDGFIERTGEMRKTERDNEAFVWRITNQGRAAMQERL